MMCQWGHISIYLMNNTPQLNEISKAPGWHLFKMVISPGFRHAFSTDWLLIIISQCRWRDDPIGYSFPPLCSLGLWLFGKFGYMLLAPLTSSSVNLEEGNDNPLLYSCLENSMDRGAWRATVHGVTQSWTWLSNIKGNTSLNKGESLTKRELLAWPGDPILLPPAPVLKPSDSRA